MKQLKSMLQKRVLGRIDLGRDVSDEELKRTIQEVIDQESSEQYIRVRNKCRLQILIFNSIRRLDILQELIENPEITEIMVNGTDDIFIEKEGRVRKWPDHFESMEKLEDVAQQIAAGSNRIVNSSNPIVDARLPCGSRVNIVLPPVALNGPTITIRKFPKETMTMEKLITLHSINIEAAQFLQNLVKAGYNIFISGGTGSGKTTFLNALSNHIPADERIITIEDSAELQLRNVKNLVRLEVRNANMEGNNEVSIRDLIKTSLRMRPERIVVGEVRDAACIDMLQALNTGHCGMSTGHANSTRDILSRLETMVLLGADIPLLAVRKQIASALDIVVQLGRLRDRSRRVLEICEVLDCVDGEIRMNPLYEFKEYGEKEDGKVEGDLIRTGNNLVRTQKLASAGLRFVFESQKL